MPRALRGVNDHIAEASRHIEAFRLQRLAKLHEQRQRRNERYAEEDSATAADVAATDAATTDAVRWSALTAEASQQPNRKFAHLDPGDGKWITYVTRYADTALMDGCRFKCAAANQRLCVLRFAALESGILVTDMGTSTTRRLQRRS